MPTIYNMPDDAQFMVDDRIAIRKASDFNEYRYHVTQASRRWWTFRSDNLKNIRQPVLVFFGDDNLIPNRFLNGGRRKNMQNGHSQLKNSRLLWCRMPVTSCSLKTGCDK